MKVLFTINIQEKLWQSAMNHERLITKGFEECSKRLILRFFLSPFIYLFTKRHYCFTRFSINVEVGLVFVVVVVVVVVVNIVDRKLREKDVFLE